MEWLLEIGERAMICKHNDHFGDNKDANANDYDVFEFRFCDCGTEDNHSVGESNCYFSMNPSQSATSSMTT